MVVDVYPLCAHTTTLLSQKAGPKCLSPAPPRPFIPGHQVAGGYSARPATPSLPLYVSFTHTHTLSLSLVSPTLPASPSLCLSFSLSPSLSLPPFAQSPYIPGHRSWPALFRDSMSRVSGGKGGRREREKRALRLGIGV